MILKVYIILLLAFVITGCEIVQSPNSENKQDSTSHSFTLFIDTLGDNVGSVLRDVKIINDSLVIAVGEILIKNPADTMYTISHAIAVWNGTSWTPHPLYYNTNMLIPEVFGIYALNENEMYLAAGSIFKWNRITNKTELVFSRLTLPDPHALIRKLWGYDNIIYGIGTRGTLVRYDGNTWKSINSGTTLELNDIWGADDPKTHNNKILAVASDHDVNNGKAVIQINADQSITMHSNIGLNWNNSGVWFSNSTYVITGDGIFTAGSLGSPWMKAVNTTNYTTAVRGNNERDIIIGGINMLLWHYNGVSWHNYFPEQSGIFTKVDIKNDFMIAVGVKNNMAIVCRGYR